MSDISNAAIDLIFDNLVDQLASLHFGLPIQCVYNPLVYASAPHRLYWHKHGGSPKEILLLGMNPGPWGMAQTGVPFGDVELVQGWLGVCDTVATPETMHLKRPILGFACRRREVSGQRLWGWARDRFKTPERFFKRFFVANYCPLVFMEESGRNRTPDKLPRREKDPLLAACDAALVEIVQQLRPKWVVGVGKFAADQTRRALAHTKISVGQITHPSPANPKANAGWNILIEAELAEMGIKI